MKTLALLAFGLFTLNSYSQSYLIMDNGTTLTTDNRGGIFDFGHYAFPQKVTLSGGRYYVEDNSILTTIDDNGLLFKKYEVIPKSITGKGNNYFTSGSKVYGIDAKGVLKVSENIMYTNIKIFAGNFFVIDLEMYAVNPEGAVVKLETGNLDLDSIVDFGGNYFMTNTGALYTISRDGEVAHKEGFRIGMLSKKGGNYFIDSSGYLFTVKEDGELIMPALPLSLDTTRVYRLGSNYFIDNEGRFYLVDKSGNIFEKLMSDHDFRLVNVISM